jgi:hypothetical protein
MRKRLRRSDRLIEMEPQDMQSAYAVGDETMWDLGCAVASVLFFLIAIAYTIGCERLGTKEKQK